MKKNNLYCFKKSERLLKFFEFRKVFQKCEKRIKIKEFIFLSKKNSFFYPRIGILSTKRNINSAVYRNRIKRLIRETFRLVKNRLPDMDFIIIVQRDVLFLKNLGIINILKKTWNQFI